MYRRARAQHPLPPRFHIRCGVCETWVHPDAWERHPASKTHRQRTRTAAVEVSLEHTAQNNYGVVVSHHQTGLDFGVVDIASASAGVSAALTIRSVTPQPNIKILSATLASQIAGRTSSFVVAPLSNHVLDAADSLDIDVKFMREHRGFYLDRLELMFEDTRLQKRFVVTRIVQAIVGDPPEYRDMQSAAPYVPQTRVTRDPETEVIPGVPPPALKAIPYIGRLPDALG